LVSCSPGATVISLDRAKSGCSSPGKFLTSIFIAFPSTRYQTHHSHRMHHSISISPQTTSSRHTEQPTTSPDRNLNQISACTLYCSMMCDGPVKIGFLRAKRVTHSQRAKEIPNMLPGAVEPFAPPSIHHAASLRTGMTQSAVNDCLHDEMTIAFDRDTLFDCHREAQRPVIGSGTTANWEHS
jgi:hypothetical protein